MTTTRTHPTTPPAARCSACGDVVAEIHLVIDGEALTMLACTPCDRRTWLRSGLPVSLPSILADVTASPTRFRRDLAVR